MNNVTKIKDFKRRHLARKFKELGFTKGAEIGVRTGKFSRVLCEENDSLHLMSIDPYIVGYEDVRARKIGIDKQEKFYQGAKELLGNYNCSLIRKESLDAVRDIPYESLDFVYIDGNHQFDYVMCDIIEWAKRVRKGGIVAGHDYFKFRDAEVVEAVNIYVKVHNIKELFLTDERTPSWWFIRE